MAQFFYVWISVLNLFIVSVFWSFLLELFDANQTRRLFGVIAAGGTTGALVGPLLTDLTVSPGSATRVCCTWAPGFLSSPSSASADCSGLGPACPRTPLRRVAGPADGRQSVFRIQPGAQVALPSRHLAVRNPAGLGQHLPVLRATAAGQRDLHGQRAAHPGVRATGLHRAGTRRCCLQLFITGRVASKLGVVVLLTVVPVIMVGGFLGLAAVNTFCRAGSGVCGPSGGRVRLHPARPRDALQPGGHRDQVQGEEPDRRARVSRWRCARGPGEGRTGSRRPVQRRRGAARCDLAAAWALNGWWLGRRAGRPDVKAAA